MREQQDRDFLIDVIKWFIIWNILILLVKLFVFCLKFEVMVIKQIIYFIIIRIKKFVQIVKDKVEQFKIDYNQQYKPELDNKIFHVKRFFFNMCSNLKNKIIALKVRILKRIELKLKKKKRTNHL